MRFIMKKLSLVITMAMATGIGFAQEMGQVLSSTPIIAQVRP